MKENLKPLAKFLFIVIIGPVFFAFCYKYFTSLNDVAVWLWAWMLGFGWIVHCNWAFETKGWLFLVFSVVLAAIGQDLFKGPEYAFDLLSVSLLSQIMIVTGSGVGANLIAHWMINEKSRAKSQV